MLSICISHIRIMGMQQRYIHTIFLNFWLQSAIAEKLISKSLRFKYGSFLLRGFSKYLSFWRSAIPPSRCNILTFEPGQKCYSKVMHRKEVTHSNGSYERKSRGRKLADEMGRAKKSHDTLIDWRTGREWPLNCMTVISAWWRLNMRFQRSSGRSSRRWTII